MRHANETHIEDEDLEVAGSFQKELLFVLVSSKFPKEKDINRTGFI